MSLRSQEETDPAAHTAPHQNSVWAAQTLQDSPSVLHPVGKLHPLQASLGITDTRRIIPEKKNVLLSLPVNKINFTTWYMWSHFRYKIVWEIRLCYHLFLTWIRVCRELSYLCYDWRQSFRRQDFSCPSTSCILSWSWGYVLSELCLPGILLKLRRIWGLSSSWDRFCSKTTVLRKAYWLVTSYLIFCLSVFMFRFQVIKPPV